MFSGIVQANGIVTHIEKGPKKITLRVRAPKSFGKPSTGSSVAVNGCCLTVTRKGDLLAFDLLRETWKRTAFAKTSKGERVNLERPLKYGDELGGHFVLGHVDGVGKIVKTRRKGVDREVTIQAPSHVMKYAIYKGSVAVDGVSLTLAGVSRNTFSVWIIPHTAKMTTLGWKDKGDWVNLEADMILKYAEQHFKK